MTTADKAAEDLKAMMGAQGFLLVVLCPATGGIIARALGQPFWYGAVVGGWVLVGLGARTINRRAKALAAYTAQAKTLTDVTAELQERLAKMRLSQAGLTDDAVHTTDPTVPPRDWVREPPNPY